MPQEFWETLPPCVRLHGLIPNDIELPPRFDEGLMGRKQLGCLVQHNLLDMWEMRCRLDTQVPGPVPRWIRMVRPRLDPERPADTMDLPAIQPLQPASRPLPDGPGVQRNVRPRLEAIPTMQPGTRGEIRSAEPANNSRNVRRRQTWVRRVRARQSEGAAASSVGVTFQPGGQLATVNGEHLR